jgi:sortase A
VWERKAPEAPSAAVSHISALLKGPVSTVVLVAMLVVGLGLIAYPSVSDAWNRLNATRVVENYDLAVAELPAAELTEMLDAATAYNESLLTDGARYDMDEAARARYDALLDVDGAGTMGYVQIPRLSLSLPVGHGTGDELLQHAIGHLEGTSLPVGGAGTHAVLIGHRGLPSARLFTDIDQLAEGDLFYVNVLGRTLAYEVDAVWIVLPEDFSHFALEPDGDFCTLVTCTPYGINSHRLLVRGHRVSLGSDAPVFAEAAVVEPRLVALGFALPLAVLALLAVLVVRRVGRG